MKEPEKAGGGKHTIRRQGPEFRNTLLMRISGGFRVSEWCAGSSMFDE
ncbi:hypothetical protein HOLDEFILI_01603 [Holdemania filiformis DSM 12042]|uniref:Uncharacterized protein n=1 Tax=Holdemania filiformis DSM 12042 TaxID=545696 RepID=B9Y709_9FIRM|nr:hypothetical protein HOLDEFILI_01603 [Holdemania filiformis DSM 12042]